MYMIIMYDLSMKNNIDKRAYSKFRRTIKSIGFYHLNNSVYMKKLNSSQQYNYIEDYLRLNLNGHIIGMKITDENKENMFEIKNNVIKNKEKEYYDIFEL